MTTNSRLTHQSKGDTIEFNGHYALTPMTGESESRFKFSHRLPPPCNATFTATSSATALSPIYSAVQPQSSDIMMASSIVHMVGYLSSLLSLPLSPPSPLLSPLLFDTFPVAERATIVNWRQWLPLQPLPRASVHADGRRFCRQCNPTL